MSDPIQQLKDEVRQSLRGRQEFNHRNEWPKLWEAIDRIVALAPSEYMVTADQDEPEMVMRYIDGIRHWLPKDQVSDEMEEPEPWVSEPMREVEVEEAQGAEFGRLPDGEMVRFSVTEVSYPAGVSYIPQAIIESSEPDEDEVDAMIPLADIVSFAGTNPKIWATWFKVYLEENPDTTIEELAEWFEVALMSRPEPTEDEMRAAMEDLYATSIKTLEEADDALYPLIEVTFDEDGEVSAMKTYSPDPDDPGLDPPDWPLL